VFSPISVGVLNHQMSIAILKMRPDADTKRYDGLDSMQVNARIDIGRTPRQRSADWLYSEVNPIVSVRVLSACGPSSHADEACE
jgi:hypothetical protein